MLSSESICEQKSPGRGGWKSHRKVSPVFTAHLQSAKQGREGPRTPPGPRSPVRKCGSLPEASGGLWGSQLEALNRGRSPCAAAWVGLRINQAVKCAFLPGLGLCQVKWRVMLITREREWLRWWRQNLKCRWKNALTERALTAHRHGGDSWLTFQTRPENEHTEDRRVKELEGLLGLFFQP